MKQAKTNLDSFGVCKGVAPEGNSKEAGRNREHQPVPELSVGAIFLDIPLSRPVVPRPAKSASEALAQLLSNSSLLI